MDIMIFQKNEIFDPKFDEEIWNIYNIPPPLPTCLSVFQNITGEYEVLLGFSMGGGLAMELALRLMVRRRRGGSVGVGVGDLEWYFYRSDNISSIWHTYLYSNINIYICIYTYSYI